MNNRLREWGFLPAQRPFVAFMAVDEKHAKRLYRAQNMVWVWLGVSTVLSALAYFFRPDLGVVLVTKTHWVDLLRVVIFAVGGSFITIGVLAIRRAVEVIGHILFSAGSLITAVATTSFPGPQGLPIVLLVGLALASIFRAFFISQWIQATNQNVPPSS